MMEDAGEGGSVYYYNSDSQESTYQHPLLQQAKFAVDRQRQEHERSVSHHAGGSYSASRPPAAPPAERRQPLPLPVLHPLPVTPEQPQAQENSEQSAAWEARRQQLELAAGSPELGYADPWATQGDADEHASSPRVLGRGASIDAADLTAGYIDSWATQEEHSPPGSQPGLGQGVSIDAPAGFEPEPEQLLTPPGMGGLEARLARMAAPETPPSATAPATPSFTPAARRLTPPTTRELEARLASLAGRDTLLQTTLAQASPADVSSPAELLQDDLASMAARSPQGRLSRALAGAGSQTPQPPGPGGVSPPFTGGGGGGGGILVPPNAQMFEPRVDAPASLKPEPEQLLTPPGMGGLEARLASMAAPETRPSAVVGDSGGGGGMDEEMLRRAKMTRKFTQLRESLADGETETE